MPEKVEPGDDTCPDATDEQEAPPQVLADHDLAEKVDSAEPRFDVARGLQEVVMLLEQHYEWSNVSFSLDIEGDLRAAIGSAGALQQAWLNLLNNAFHALCRKDPPGGVIVIKARYYNRLRKIIVEISDDGPASGEKTVPRPGDVTGIASVAIRGEMRLKRAEQIVDEYGGAIDVAHSPGRGTRVRVILPTGTTTSEGTMSEPKRDEQRDLLGAQLLVLEGYAELPLAGDEDDADGTKANGIDDKSD